MPSRGISLIPREEILSFEEILRLVRLMANLGVTKIKVKGGEALTRKGIIDLVRQLRKIAGIEQVTLTSNGILLMPYLDSLISAGLNALNISLDTLNAETFAHITQSDG